MWHESILQEGCGQLHEEGFAGRPVSRVLSRSLLADRAETVISLAGRLPARSSAAYPRVLTGRTSPALLFGLAPGGVCRASLSPGCWWALTPPFHPYLGPKPRAVYFLLHFPYPWPSPCGGGLGRWTLSTTVSFGARTFLSPAPPRLTRTHAEQRPSSRRAGPFHPIRFVLTGAWPLLY